MVDDFTEEESYDELPEEFQDEPQPKKKAGRPATVAPTRQRIQSSSQAPAPVAQTQQPIPTTPQQKADRFTPYMMAKRVGVYDNQMNKPMMEDVEVDNVLLGLITIILNDLDDIKKRL